MAGHSDGPVVVIGAGVGGLAAAAVLARQGLDVTVLEAHVYPGGCAGAFPHQGYRFDAGATLPGGFYPGGPMDLVARAAGITAWEALPAAHPAMVVHLPDGAPVSLDGGEDRWERRRHDFGPAGERFWHWQEATADALWDLALRLPDWPPQSAADLARLAATGSGWLANLLRSGRIAHLPQLARDAFRPVAAHLAAAPARLRALVDAQLLISAQAGSAQANALYGAAALDLPRRGVVHLDGGMGRISQDLAQAVRQNGGRVHFRQEATRIVFEHGQPVAVETRRGGSFPARLVIANLPPWNVARLAGDGFSLSGRRAGLPEDAWGAFVVYAGIDGSVVPEGLALHHQVVAGKTLGEGNTVFLSLSPAWDASRAPAGRRAVTLSTHTRLPEWWRLFESDPEGYQARQAAYTDRLLAVAERALPGLRQAAGLVLPGTPVTFQRFTRRYQGWVGGFPQTSLGRAWGPRLSPGLWLVGDSIFPGQSTAAVALGGLRVAGAVIAENWGEVRTSLQQEENHENRNRRQWPGWLDRRILDGNARRRP